ncbi:MAG: hypothetical protein ACTHKR_14405 [Sphingomonas sp.]
MADRDLTAPPQRYRIEERDGQLVVIDEGNGRRPERWWTVLARNRRPARGRDERALLQRFYRWIAAMACKGRTDGSGRLIFTTDKRDSKGPRSFALDSSGTRHLAHGTLAGIAVVIAMTGMVLIDVKTGVSISAVFGLALSAGGKRAYTRWVDGFGDALIDD